MPAKRDEDQGKVERAQGIAHKGGALLGRGIGALKRRADQYHVIEEAGKMKDKVCRPPGQLSAVRKHPARVRYSAGLRGAASCPDPDDVRLTRRVAGPRG